MAKQVSPGVLALRKVVDDVYADAREAKKQGKLVGWSSSKFPCELAEAFDLNVMYPENQAAGIAAQRDGEIMCQAAEDLGFDTDGFFGGGDVGGDEDAAVGGGVEPALAVAFTLLWGVGAVHHYLFFEGVAEELEVAVGL